MKKFPCWAHKIVEGNETITLINYLTYGWCRFKEHRFMGFIPTHEDCVASLKLDGKNYIACHVFFCDGDYFLGDEFFKEKPYILMFMGNDDLSYAKRFKSFEDALKFFDKTDVFTKDVQRQCKIYN